MAAVQLRGLLAAALPPHYKIIQAMKCSTEQEIMELKASLWAVGNAALSGAGLQQVLAVGGEETAPHHVLRLAKYSPVYSVRATAFYVLGLFGSTFEGANLLSDLGWICVRHTRHDQFPIIPDESYSPYDKTGDGNYITSPERRYNAFDIELSEHSDHTDLSTAESVHSDTKHGIKTLVDHDVVDHKTPYNESRREVSKRKSHTLPTQGCSTSHDRPALTESRTVDILRDCSSYERPGPHRLHFENRLLLGRMNSLEHHEGRVRNTSESSTSGVSSCDSAGGKYAIPDRILTLSPIPSSSSLYGMKSSSSSHRPRLSELQRRTSTSSFSTCEVASSPPTQMDMSGYATLKTINKHRRPHLSESAASGSSELDDLTWLLTDTQRRSKPFSSLRDRAKSTRERMTKLSLLDYDWKPLPLSEGGRTTPPPAAREPPRRAPQTPCAPPSHPAHPAHPPHLPPAPHVPHPPPYIGICLPTDLKELFPRDEDDKEDIETEKRVPFGRTGLNLFPAEYSNISTDNKTNDTPEHHAAHIKDGTPHTLPISVPQTTGMNVTTVAGNTNNNISFEIPEDVKISKPEIKNTVKIDTGKPYDYIKINKILNLDKIQETSTDNINVTKTDNIEKVSSPDHVAKFLPGSVPKSSTLPDKVSTKVTSPDKTGNKVAIEGPSALDLSISEKINVSTGSGSRWRHSTADCLACVKTRPPSSHELREAFFAAMESPSTSVPSDLRSRSVSPASDTLCPQAEVLHHVHFMSNPIHLRQARSTLISLKQRYPEVFRSPCVYSDVCVLLARDTYMLCARRFLQDLFLDVSFECFAHEPAKVLSRHGAILSPTQVKP